MFKLVKEIKSKSGELHFRRYRIIETPWLSIYLHYIAKSDEDKHPHNHPWNFFSIVFMGIYYEDCYSKEVGEYGRYSRFFNYHTHKEYHKLKLAKPVRSLVFCGKKRNKDCGYWVDGKHIQHEKYREMKHNSEL